jgi:hypothetical protein
MEDSDPFFNLNTINEYILEIRFKPNPKVLDCRGKWAELLASVLNMPHWRISENRIDIYGDKEKIEEALENSFISFRNAGYVIKNCPSGNHFFKRTKLLIEFLFDRKEAFGKKIHIERIGVRSRFGNEFIGSFNDMLDLYMENYMSPNSNIRTLFDADIIDFGGHLTFKNKSSEVEMTTMTGPMEKEQLKNFFPFVDNPPEPIFYFEIDSFIKPDVELDIFKVQKTVDELIRSNWSKNNNVVRLVSGEK